MEGLFEWVLSWQTSPAAPWALLALAFAEASFFPVPPDTLQIALSLLTPQASLGYAALSTVGSVLGGAFGYLLGWKGGRPILDRLVAEEKIRLVEDYYERYSVWAIAIAGFTPIPYKLFTISAGVFTITFRTFILVSLISRGARFFLVGILLYQFGEPIQNLLARYFNLASLIFAVLLIGGFLAIHQLARRAGRKGRQCQAPPGNEVR